MLLLGFIIRKHRLSFHFYMNDTQIYLPLKRSSNSLETLIACLIEVKTWLSSNLLNFN